MTLYKISTILSLSYLLEIIMTRILEFSSKLRGLTCSISLLQCHHWVNLNEIIIDSDDKELLNEAEDALSMFKKLFSVAKIKQLNDIKKLCDDELEYLASIHTQSTLLRTDIPAYNHSIRRIAPRHPALAFFKETKKLVASNMEYQSRVKNRAGERVFKDVDGFVATAKRLLGSNSYISIGMGLAALTGRRPSEILLTASFKETTEREIIFGDKVIEIDECVVFAGQLKTKNAVDACDNYLIPTLINADIILSTIDKLRKFKDLSHLNENIVDKNGRNLTPGQRVNSLTASGQKKCVKQYFTSFFGDGKVSPHDLRHAYALISASRYCTSSNQYPKFYSKILGHREGDDLTSHSYMTLCLEE